MQFILPFPQSANSKYNMHGKKRVKSQRDKEWIEKATTAINQQNVLPFVGRCYIIYELYHPDGRPRDAANYEKKVTDLLVSLKILAGDERRYVKGDFIYWNDKPGKQIIVRIISVEDFKFPSMHQQ